MTTSRLFHIPSGTFGDVDEKEVNAALRSGEFSFDPELKEIPVISPDGKVGKIPASQVTTAFKQGYTIPTTEESMASADQANEKIKEDNYGSSTGAAAVQGFLSGATFGASDAAIRALDETGVVPGVAEAALETKDRNTGAYIAGEIASVFAPGGGALGAGAKLARKGLGQLGKLGAINATKKALLNRAVNITGGKLGQAIAKRIPGATAATLGSAVEGALWGTKEVITEAALGDPKLNAEHATSLIMDGAILGGVLGGTLSGVGVTGGAINEVTKEFRNKMLGKAKIGLRKAATPSAEKVRGAFGDDLERVYTELRNSPNLSESVIQAPAFAKIEKRFTKEVDQLVDEAPEEVSNYLGVLRAEAAQGEERVVRLAEHYAGTPVRGDMAFSGTLQTLKDRVRGYTAKRTGDPEFSKFQSMMDNIDEGVLARTEGIGPNNLKNLADEIKYTHELRKTIGDIRYKGSPDDKGLHKILDDAYGSLGKKLKHDSDIPDTIRLAYQQHDTAFQKLIDTQNKLKGVAERKFQLLDEKGRRIFHVSPKKVENMLKTAEGRESVLQVIDSANKHGKETLEMLTTELGSTKFVDDLAVIMDGVNDSIRKGDDLSSRISNIPEKGAGLDELVAAAKKAGKPVDPIIETMLPNADLIGKLNFMKDQIPKNTSMWYRVSRGLDAVANSGIGWGIVSGMGVAPAIKAKALAGAMQLATANPYEKLVMLGKLEKTIHTSTKVMTAGITKVAKSLTSKPVRTGILAGAAETKKPKKKATRQERRKAYQKDVQEINKINNPERMLNLNQHTMEMFGDAAPEHAMAMATTMQTAGKFLKSKLPIDPTLSTNIYGNKSEYIPSDMELYKYNRYLSAVRNPVSVLNDLSKGVINIEGIETLKVVYPSIFQDLQKRVMQAIMEKQPTMTYKSQLVLSSVFGLPAHATLTPEFISRRQASYAQENNGEQGGRPKTKSVPPMEPLTQSTEVQRLTSRKEK